MTAPPGYTRATVTIIDYAPKQGWLGGQSNGAGAAKIRIGDADPIPGAYIYGYKVDATHPIVYGWEAATVPINRYTTGPTASGATIADAYGFQPEMLRQLVAGTGGNVGLVSNAISTTKLSQWVKGTANWINAVGRLKGIRVDFIVWHQGEGDVANPDYLATLCQFIDDWRTELANPNLPFVVGEILYSRTGAPTYGAALNAQLAQLPALRPFTAVASAQGLLSYPPSDVHFDHPSYDVLGARYAAALLPLLGYSP